MGLGEWGRAWKNRHWSIDIGELDGWKGRRVEGGQGEDGKIF
jgi:hypothetical protein